MYLTIIATQAVAYVPSLDDYISYLFFVVFFFLPLRLHFVPIMVLCPSILVSYI